MRPQNLWPLLAALAVLVAGCSAKGPDPAPNAGAAATGKFDSPRKKTSN